MTQIAHAVFSLLILLGTFSASAATRALIIANESYNAADLPKLPGVASEAKALADKLTSMNMTVYPHVDLDMAAMTSAINAFISSLAKGDLAFIYYGGHGVQANGVNYLMPLGAKATDVSSGINLDREILQRLATRETRANLVFIDACRDLPAVPDGGLAQPGVAPTDTLIVFSTAPNRTAANPSSFTSALVRYIGEAGTRIEDIVQKIRSDVLAVSNSAQRPQEFGTLRSAIQLRPPAIVRARIENADDDLQILLEDQTVLSLGQGRWGGKNDSVKGR